MSAGQSKIELLLELKNKLKAGLNSARDTLNKSVGSMKQKMAEIKSSSIEAFSAAKDQIPGLSNALDLLSNPYALITASVLALGAAWITAGKMNAEWRSSMAKVNVTAQLSQKELKGLSDNLIEIGKTGTGDIMQVPETFNKIISAGFDVNTSLNTLKPTLLAAKAGFTDAGIAADAATNLMASSGIMDANRIFDILFATVNKGKAEFADIATYLPKIIPGARMAGVSLEQTAGMFAFLTASGLKSEAASTALANAMKALSDPEIVYGSKTKGGFKALGVDIFDSHGKMRDIVVIAGMLNKAMDGLTDEQRINKFSKIGLDMESSMAFSKMSQGIDQLKTDIDFTTNSQGQLNEAVKNSVEPLDSWKIIMNEVKASAIAMGESGVTALGKIGDWILNNSEILSGFAYVIGGISAAWGIYTLVTSGAAIATGLETAAMWALNLAMSANPVGLIVTGIGALIGGLVFAYKHSQTFRASLAGLLAVGGLLMDLFSSFGKVMVGAFTLNPSMIKDGLTQGADALSNIMDGGIKKAYDRGYDTTVQDEKKAELEKQKTNVPAAVPPPLVPKKAGNKAGSGIPTTPSNGDASKVTGSAQQIKNLTINMDAMVKMGDFVSQNPEVSKMGKKELEEWFTQLCNRMIMNIQTSYGS
jgi:TP901 family phage tail tape measure protein